LSCSECVPPVLLDIDIFDIYFFRGIFVFLGKDIFVGDEFRRKT